MDPWMDAAHRGVTALAERGQGIHDHGHLDDRSGNIDESRRQDPRR